MSQDIYISEHFLWSDVTDSETAERLGIDNSLPESLKPAAIRTARNMEKIRALIDSPIFVTSWYRGPGLQSLPQFYNPTSQHPTASAVDFKSPSYGTPADICKKIVKYADLIRFDQLILEHSWVHVSWVYDPNVKPRGEVLSLLRSKKYASGLTDREGNLL